MSGTTGTSTEGFRRNTRRVVAPEAVGKSTRTRLAAREWRSTSCIIQSCPPASPAGLSGSSASSCTGASLLAPGGLKVRSIPGRWSRAPKKKGSSPNAAVSTSKTRSPREESARPSEATRLVLPTPPAREKTASTGTLAGASAGACSTVAACGSKTLLSANQPLAMRSREPASVSSAKSGDCPDCCPDCCPGTCPAPCPGCAPGPGSDRSDPCPAIACRIPPGSPFPAGLGIVTAGPDPYPDPWPETRSEN